MKSTVTMSALGGALLLASLTSVAAAAPSKPAQAHKPTKMTCEEFVVLDESIKPKIVYWLEGFNKKGKPVDEVVDIDATDKVIPMLVTECQRTPKASFWQKLKSHF